MDPDWESLLPEHSEEHQVRLDTDRAFNFYPTGASGELLKADRQALYELIVHVLRLHPSLAYFQGLHDIAQVLLLVLGRRRAVPVLEHLALTRLRDFMMPDLESSVDHLRLIPPLLAQVDEPLATLLSKIRPHHALAAVITLFAHVIESYPDISLIFDFFFASDSMAMPIYLYAVIVIARRDELFEFDGEDAQMLEAILSRFPTPLPIAIADATSRALALYRQYPPSSLLPQWRHIPRYSVLKTLEIEETVNHNMNNNSRKQYTVSRRRRSSRSSAAAEKEFDYIELEEVRQPADYTHLDSLLAQQIADSTARAKRLRAREARERKLRAARLERERRSATRKLAALPGVALRKAFRIRDIDDDFNNAIDADDADDIKTDKLDGSMVVLENPSSNSSALRKQPIAGSAHVNGTANFRGLRRFKFDNIKTFMGWSSSSTIAAISLSICFGFISWWVAWFLRRDY